MIAEFEVAGITLGCSTAAAVSGVPLLLALRRRPLWAMATALCVWPIVAIVVGVTVTARLMFLSQHDLRTILIIVGVSAVVASTFALRVGRPIVAGTGALTRAAATLGDPGYRGAGRVPTTELATLAATLDATNTRLVESLARERALEASRRELVAWISHDLRTPLAGIRAMAEAFEDGLITDVETTDRYHRRMLTEAERLTGMVDDLFELARLQAGALRLSLAKVRVADVVSDAVAAVDPIARARGVVVRGEADDLGFVDADAAEVGRALTNLLVNAIRHTPDDGTVEVTATMAADQALFSVADRCGGIPAQDLLRVFDLGFRGEPARTPTGDDGPGQPRSRSGIGLAIVRGIIEAHGGAVSVHNQPGGCRFVVALPTS
ncbi:HAMP domain-containing histidine kinase [Frankia sp. AiPs1]|uniref:sensor histidine kinase n=1 Tax=Frankia sp. AiPs1 TaxID=573493 RepID=UPI0020441503|nr:HAMP domain-containing sensor histidine kinase [Frankia sp. AiPs1]MCM3922911.1 HAMP domain-containing histidine kinase [Frankia sp. AiPs1]